MNDGLSITASWVKLADVVEQVSTFASLQQVGPNALGLVTLASLSGRRNTLGSHRGAATEDGTLFQPGDCLYARTHPRMRRAWHADREGVAATRQIFVLRPNPAILPEYLDVLLRAAPFAFRAERFQAGDSDAAIQFSDFASIEVPIPTKQTQARLARIFDIVDLLDDDWKEWQKDHQKISVQVFKEVFNSSVQKQEVSLGTLIEAIEQGPKLRPYEHQATPLEVGVIGSSAVTTGFFEPSANRALPPQAVFLPSETLFRNDLLLCPSSSQHLVGRCALVERDYSQLVLSERLWRIQPKAGVLSAFLKGLLDSPASRQRITKWSRKPGNTNTLSKKDLLSLPAFRAPLERQQVFAQWLEAQLDTISGHRALSNDLSGFRDRIELMLFEALPFSAQQQPFDETHTELPLEQRPVWGFLSPFQQQLWAVLKRVGPSFTQVSLRHHFLASGGKPPPSDRLLRTLELFEVLGVASKSSLTFVDEWTIPHLLEDR